MRLLRPVLSLCVLGLLLTTSHGNTKKINLIVRINCLTGPVELVDCDFSNIEHPKCKSANISYRPSCAEIDLKK